MSFEENNSGSSRLRRVRYITEIVANIVIVGAVVAGCVVWVTQSKSSDKSTSARVQYPVPGTPINLAGASWDNHPSTLIIAISSECPHCINEAAFYRDLTHSAHRDPILVVMPQQPDTARSFLNENGITPSRTFSADLRDIDVKVTPTIILVSPRGEVSQTWVGELDSNEKAQVVAAIDHL